MKIVIAMDSFKGTLSANEACQIVADAIAESFPNIHLVIKPMADGGEGTARAMIEAADGKWIPQIVMGPLPDMEVQAGFAWFDTDKTALVEMAAASGLELLSEDQMDPLKTTTYGTGQLIKAAVEYGAKKILLAVGGSATVDGGVGAAAAIGYEFLDRQGKPVSLGGAGLEKIAEIIVPRDLNMPSVEVLCDVDNPLCGEHGAAEIYGPQKGATDRMVRQLEKGLANLARLVKKQFNRDIADVPGTGAAGGLSAGAMVFMNAALVSGIEMIIERSNLAAELHSADWVVTGEGSFDRQSLYGKVVSGVAEAALKSNTPVAVLAGQVTVPQEEFEKLGIVTAIPAKPVDMPLDDTIKNCRPLLRSAAKQFAKQYLTL